MSGAADILAARRLAITEAAPRRLIPTGHLCRRVACGPLDDRVREINASGELAPGLLARREHLVCWAAVAALADHPHFNAFYLPAGLAHQADSVSLRLPLDGPGSLAAAVLPGASSLSLARLAEALDAWLIEAAGEARSKTRRRVRKHRSSPWWHRAISDPLLGSLSWLRDHLGLPRAWIGLAVARAGSFTVHGLDELGAEAVSGPLCGARVVELACCAPERSALPADRSLPIEVSYDLRLFEAFEVADFLAAICQHLDALADPPTAGSRA